MSRQPGESMTSYTGRRKRWYRKPKELDDSLEISDTIRADLRLDNCGLDRKERLMILTAVGDKPSSFAAIEKALITQHGKLHFLESKAAPKAPGPRVCCPGKSLQGQRQRKEGLAVSTWPIHKTSSKTTEKMIPFGILRAKRSWLKLMTVSQRSWLDRSKMRPPRTWSWM